MRVIAITKKCLECEKELIFDTYFEPKEENKVYLTKEDLVNYAKLFANKSDKDTSCM